jgi:hypothetical protein
LRRASETTNTATSTAARLYCEAAATTANSADDSFALRIAPRFGNDRHCYVNGCPPVLRGGRYDGKFGGG